MYLRFATSKTLARTLAALSMVAFLAVSCPVAGATEAFDFSPEEISQIQSDEFQKICRQQLPATSIQVTALPSKIVYANSEGLAELTSRSTENGMSALGRTLGLTESKYAYESKIKTAILTHPETGMSCARAGIQIDIVTGPQKISIAREFKPGTCAYSEIINHELRHARANQGVAERTADALQRQMIDYYGSKIFYGTEQSLRTQMKREVETHWFEWIKPQAAAVNKIHTRIDSREEYARVGISCEGEITEMLKTHRLQPNK